MVTVDEIKGYLNIANTLGDVDIQLSKRLKFVAKAMLFESGTMLDYELVQLLDGDVTPHDTLGISTMRILQLSSEYLYDDFAYRCTVEANILFLHLVYDYNLVISGVCAVTEGANINKDDIMDVLRTLSTNVTTFKKVLAFLDTAGISLHMSPIVSEIEELSSATSFDDINIDKIMNGGGKK